jgi:hypothetical protein
MKSVPLCASLLAAISVNRHMGLGGSRFLVVLFLPLPQTPPALTSPPFREEIGQESYFFRVEQNAFSAGIIKDRQSFRDISFSRVVPPTSSKRALTQVIFVSSPGSFSLDPHASMQRRPRIASDEFRRSASDEFRQRPSRFRSEPFSTPRAAVHNRGRDFICFSI